MARRSRTHPSPPSTSHLAPEQLGLRQPRAFDLMAHAVEESHAILVFIELEELRQDLPGFFWKRRTNRSVRSSGMLRHLDPSPRQEWLQSPKFPHVELFAQAPHAHLRCISGQSPAFPVKTNCLGKGEPPDGKSGNGHRQSNKCKQNQDSISSRHTGGDMHKQAVSLGAGGAGNGDSHFRGWVSCSWMLPPLRIYPIEQCAGGHKGECALRP